LPSDDVDHSTGKYSLSRLGKKGGEKNNVIIPCYLKHLMSDEEDMSTGAEAGIRGSKFNCDKMPSSHYLSIVCHDQSNSMVVSGDGCNAKAGFSRTKLKRDDTCRFYSYPSSVMIEVIPLMHLAMDAMLKLVLLGQNQIGMMRHDLILHLSGVMI
jgi:hypothetical protein